MQYKKSWKLGIWLGSFLYQWTTWQWWWCLQHLSIWCWENTVLFWFKLLSAMSFVSSQRWNGLDCDSYEAFQCIVTCHNWICNNLNRVSHSNFASPIMFIWTNHLILKSDLMVQPLRKQSLLLLDIIILITWQIILVNHSQREAMGILEDMPKLK